MPNDNTVEQEQSFISHLIELRDRLLKAIVFILVIFVILFTFANDLYSQLAEPLRSSLPEGATMIATGVASPFLTPFKLSLVLSIFIAMPYLLYQIWSFIAPGLYQHEKKLAMPLLFSSIILFYSGMVFAFYVVFPLMFAFFAATTPEGVAMMTDISEYLDFVLKMFFAFGVAFEVPIATILLVIGGVTTAEKLADKRPYVIVGSFVLGMLLTPPDIISQVLLAIPIWLLFELGIIFSRFIKAKRDEDNDEDDEEAKAADKEFDEWEDDTEEGDFDDDPEDDKQDNDESQEDYNEYDDDDDDGDDDLIEIIEDGEVVEDNYSQDNFSQDKTNSKNAIKDKTTKVETEHDFSDQVSDADMEKLFNSDSEKKS